MSRLPRDLVIFGTVEISDPRFEVAARYQPMPPERRELAHETAECPWK
jgi:hypothetical protein